MKRLVLVAVLLLAAGSLLAGGDGKSCHKSDVKAVQLTGTIACLDGATGEDCARVFRVANSETEYRICDKSRVKLTKLNGANVRVTGKLVNCDEGEELVIDRAVRL